jgi:hypothetical protein
MGFPHNYEIDKAKGSLEKAALNERTPKGASGGTRTKTTKMGVSVDIDSDERWKEIQRWFPGSDHVAKMLSQYDANGLKWTSSRRLGAINVEAFDEAGKAILSMVGADGDCPTLHITASAKSARVTFQVEGELSPEKARTVRDYFKADVLWSWGPAQQNLPLNNGGGSDDDGPDPNTPKRTGGRGGKKNKGNAAADKAAGGGDE